MRSSIVLCGLLGTFSFPGASMGQSQPTTRESRRHLPAGFLSKSLRLEEKGVEYRYAVFIPPQYKLNPNHRWPLILFLHGSGECGEDGIRQTTVGLPVYVSVHAAQFPFIVVMPQAHSMWFRGQEAAAVWRAMADTMRDYRVDPDRVYITGLSMGGFGAWELAMTQPDAFAAIVPVCGAAPKDFLPNVMRLPVWAFHGAQDSHVPVAESRDAIKELRRLAGPSAKYTEFPDLGHECWDRAYAEPELWKWLLAQKRKVPRVIDYRIPFGTSRIWWLALKAKQGLKSPGRIHVEIGDNGQINAESEGIDTWGLASDREPLKPGTEIQINWNGAVVYRGLFNGSLMIKPDGSTVEPATSHPASSAPSDGKHS
jgi:predicted esterase